MSEVVSTGLYEKIKSIIDEARKKVNRVVNSAMVDAYWNVGRLIVEEEQKGEKRAEYGAELLKNLSIRLSRELGKGFDISNLKRMRQFYCLFPIGAAVRRQLPVCVQRTGRSEESGKGASLQHFSGKQEKHPVMSTQGISSTLRRELTWTHYKLLIRLENEDSRLWYMNEAADQNWSTRALERQINSLYYVSMFDDIQKGEDDNPTVGLILCTEKDKTIVKYSVLNENKQLFASKYMLYLPSEEELARELEREKRLIEMEMGKSGWEEVK